MRAQAQAVELRGHLVVLLVRLAHVQCDRGGAHALCERIDRSRGIGAALALELAQPACEQAPDPGAQREIGHAPGLDHRLQQH